MSVILKDPAGLLIDFAGYFKARRLSLDLARHTLAERSGVSESTIKRFEKTGEISLKALLNIALVLDCLDDFEKISCQPPLKAKSVNDLLKAKQPRKRGRI